MRGRGGRVVRRSRVPRPPGIVRLVQIPTLTVWTLHSPGVRRSDGDFGRFSFEKAKRPSAMPAASRCVFRLAFATVYMSGNSGPARILELVKIQ
jgi:hypothetical protein